MAILKDKQRGTWMVKRYEKDAITGKRRQILKRGFKTKRDAVQWDAAQARFEQSTGITFTELDNLYIDYKNPRKESTRNQERTRVQKYMTFAGMPMTDISKQTLMEWYVEFIKRDDIATSTKNYCIGVVKAVFKFGSDFYGLQNNAVVLKKLKKDKKKQKPFEVWTVDEFSQFIQCVDSFHYKNIFTFMYCTGLRRGEALALRAEDFNLAKGTVHIHHQIKYMKEGFIPLKTDSSERTLKLPPHVLNAVIPLVNACTDELPFVFGGNVSIPITNLQKQFTKGIKKSGVKRIRIHDLRHSFATNAINNGCNIVAVSHYLGHSTIQQTLETYTHLLEKTDDEMVQKMDAVLSAVILP